MAWSDEPTYAQINTIFQCLNWEVRELSTEEARAAAKWLEKAGTRRDVSNEIGRLKKLRDEHNLSLDNCFASEIWEGFKRDGS